ncbi:MAG: sulfurtransferase, partial [Mycobacterium sp.]
VIERNVLEWRLDPTSDARIPQAVGDDVEWIVLCSQGYTSSLAAAALRDLGLHKATDVIGGYQALNAASLAGAQHGP